MIDREAIREMLARAEMRWASVEDAEITVRARTLAELGRALTACEEALRGSRFFIKCVVEGFKSEPTRDPTGEGMEIAHEVLAEIEAAMDGHEIGDIARAALAATGKEDTDE